MEGMIFVWKIKVLQETNISASNFFNSILSCVELIILYAYYFWQWAWTTGISQAMNHWPCWQQGVGNKFAVLQQLLQPLLCNLVGNVKIVFAGALRDTQKLTWTGSRADNRIEEKGTIQSRSVRQKENTTVTGKGTEQQDISKIQFKQNNFSLNIAPSTHKYTRDCRPIKVSWYTVVRGLWSNILVSPKYSRRKKQQSFHSDDYCAKSCCASKSNGNNQACFPPACTYIRKTYTVFMCTCGNLIVYEYQVAFQYLYDIVPFNWLRERFTHSHSNLWRSLNTPGLSEDIKFSLRNLKAKNLW